MARVPLVQHQFRCTQKHTPLTPRPLRECHDNILWSIAVCDAQIFSDLLADDHGILMLPGYALEVASMLLDGSAFAVQSRFRDKRLGT